VKREDLSKSYELFKIQGFDTPIEMFLIGYLMAHGGEQLFMDLVAHDLELLEHDAEFWFAIIKDEYRIHRKVHDEDVTEAHQLLRAMLDSRKARVPSWLERMKPTEE
jgi:hypothetical protein